MKKNTYTILELIFVLSILFISLSFIKVKFYNTDLKDASENILLNLKNVRYQALIDNKYSEFDEKWYKKQWTFKFFNCSQKIGGFYYTVFSDENKKGHANKFESLKDPLSSKYLFSTWRCNKIQDNSKYVLITKEYNIKGINISCNNTKGIGQFTFTYNAKVLNTLSSSSKNIINDICEIKLTHINNDSISIFLNPNGYAYIK